MRFTINTNDKTGENLYVGELKCGLKVYIMPRKDYSATYAIFATKYGSVDSDFIVQGETEATHVPDGIAHFLEHKMFEQEDGSNVFENFSKVGAMCNAYTSFNLTGYLFKSSQSPYESLEILLDYVQKPYFTSFSQIYCRLPWHINIFISLFPLPRPLHMFHHPPHNAFPFRIWILYLYPSKKLFRIQVNIITF